MSKIGELTLGVGVETVFNLQFLPEFIIVDSIIGGEVQAASWNVAGKELVNISGITFVQAFTQYKQNILATGGTIAEVFTTGEGYLPNQQFQLRMTNNNAAAVEVFAFSRRMGNGRVLTASQVVVIDGANQRFQNFLALQFAGANVTRIDLTFKNAKTGRVFTDSYSIKELAALLALDNPTGAGTLGTLTVLDNTNLLNKVGMFIESATIFTSGANVTVLVEGLGNL